MSQASTTRRKSTFAIETHGCKLNQADSLRLAREFVAAGYVRVSADGPADVYVLNSCTVTHVADRKARHALRAARRRNPDALVVATGCYPQRAPDDLTALDEVDLVLGNPDKESLVRRVTDLRGDRLEDWEEEPFMALDGRTTRTRAMVKIQEGCDQVCAYCIVPKVRGRERSVPLDDIVADIGRCVGEGYREVVLTGTQLGTYGFEWPEISLTDLVKAVLRRTDVQRLRVSSLQPQEISGELLELWGDERLCPHFHVPLQSGSDAVLERMRRRYTSEMYQDAVERVRARVEDVSITTDVIVGFPGETEDDFRRTVELCEAVGFSDMHVFPYSPRPGTSAAVYGGQVAPAVKAERVRTLMALASDQSRRFRGRFIGTERPVLWERTVDMSSVEVWSGLTDNYIRAYAPSSEDIANRVTAARLLSVRGDGMESRILR
ncbi:MAG: tRNA (N(6)-L-threonylcarbamoyladenosine(37)-C(2))-methylthiotransferase MtaB [Chloroflexi bacterium]|nr:tRNA (N(6)-L-threonylcarbamoyladenosine(37)-C(2))-methylthiotransferase MtaB [Chloroflexota bacterium]